MRYRTKRKIFAFIPLLLLLLAATIVLWILERRGVINSERPDDWVHAPPVNWLHKEKTADGVWIRLEHDMLLTSRFPKKKPPDTLRIFVTGGSFAMGSPVVVQQMVDPCGGIGEWMRDELRLRYPRHNIEVINVGAGAQNSFRVVEIVKKLVELEPDIIFVMTGNNEGVMPRFNLNQQLHKWVLYRVMKKELLPEPTIDQRLYAKVVNSDAQVSEKYMRQNLQRIVSLTGRHDVELLLAAMPINLKPENDVIVNYESEIAEMDQPIRDGRELQAQGKYAEAIDVFAKSNCMDFSTYFIAQCWEALGDYERAKSYYLFNLSVNPGMRTQPSTNAMVRVFSRKKRVHLVDLEAVAERVSPHGIPGYNLFLDYCHMDQNGYYLMAQEALRVLETDKLIPASFGKPGPKPTMEEIVDHYGWIFLEKYSVY
ncbi:MAG TPA: hypothetical protein PKW95_06080 [bacterium]|nr:hypothetical protein [bacterium]